MRFSVAFSMVSVVQSEIILRVVAGIYLMIRRILGMPMMRRKKRLLLAALVMWLAIEPTDVQCQVQKALDDSAAMSWIREMEAKAIVEGRSLSPFLGDDRIRKSLPKRGRNPVGKRIQIGPREIAVERFFWTASAMRIRFREDPERRYQWNLMVTDIVLIGTVLSVSKEEETCVYGTQVDIQVVKYLKGTGPDTIQVKLTRGRKITDRSFLLSSGEPYFQLGEEALLQLSATPFQGHDQVVRNSTPDCIGFFYVTNTGGDYYEIAGVQDAKRNIVDGRLNWRGETRMLEEVEASLLMDLQNVF